MTHQHEVAAKALKVGVLVSRLMRSGDSQDERDALPKAAMSVLRVLHASGPMTAGALQAMRMRSHLPLRSVLDDMVEAGLVTVDPAPTAGEAALVAMTQAGREMFGARQALLAAPLAEMLRTLPEGDLRLLREATALLERLSADGAGQEPAATS